jgi:phosphate starvation-inducible PhoH-like protein
MTNSKKGNNNGNKDDLMIDFFNKSEEILLGSKKEEKKRGRKSKKMNDKEILYAHKIEESQLIQDQEDVFGINNGTFSNSFESLDESEVENNTTTRNNHSNRKTTSTAAANNKRKDTTSTSNNPTNYTKKNYENFAYLSAKERAVFEKKFTTPKNEHQEKFCNILKTKSKKIVIVNGPAGTGKTMLATEHGIRFFLTDTYEKLIFTRPSVSVDEDLGFLPGTLEEKMAPWIRPIYDVLYNFLTPKEVQQLMEDKIIEIAPLGYMRGRTFKNAWIVADEMQNATVSQMKMLLTRLGENSRLVVTGDLQQYDRTFENNGLDDFLQRLKKRGGESESIVSFEFQKTDIQREPVVKEVLDIYDGSNF